MTPDLYLTSDMLLGILHERPGMTVDEIATDARAAALECEAGRIGGGVTTGVGTTEYVRTERLSVSIPTLPHPSGGQVTPRPGLEPRPADPSSPVTIPLPSWWILQTRSLLVSLRHQGLVRCKWDGCRLRGEDIGPICEWIATAKAEQVSA